MRKRKISHTNVCNFFNLQLSLPKFRESKVRNMDPGPWTSFVDQFHGPCFDGLVKAAVHLSPDYVSLIRVR